jgi:hypothetical protein
MDERTATVCTSARISEYDDLFCDVRCPHLYGMFDRCGLYGRLVYKSNLHLFIRADDCVTTFTKPEDPNKKES